MREARAFRPYLFFAVGLFAAALLAAFLIPAPMHVQAQTTSVGSLDLGAGRAPDALPADGFYFVNDDFKFTIAHKYGVTLMRFAGDDEVFALSVERASVGGRVLKYDTGDVALQVTGYGAVTLYTSTAPGGLPADRVGNGEAITFPVPTMSALRAIAQQLANKLEQVNDLALRFDADWSHLDDDAARYLALDTMRITARAIAGICANHANQAQLAAKLRAVRIMRGDRPGVVMRNGVLTVTFAPVYGLRGRFSSLATARAIRTQL
jgi:Domain of unknown function (DUF4908)